MRLSPTVFYILKLQILIFYILKQIFPSTFQTSSGMVCLPSAANRGGSLFPHNLRHLFARTFYRVCRDVAKLADVLGRSSIETTRIYLISTGAEHAKTLDMLRLVS